MTAGGSYHADDSIRLAPRMSGANADGASEVNLVLGAPFALDPHAIEKLLLRRDRRLAAWTKSHPGRVAFEGRRLEIHSGARLNSERTLARLRGPLNGQITDACTRERVSGATLFSLHLRFAVATPRPPRLPADMLLALLAIFAPEHPLDFAHPERGEDALLVPVPALAAPRAAAEAKLPAATATPKASIGPRTFITAFFQPQNAARTVSAASVEADRNGSRVKMPVLPRRLEPVSGGCNRRANGSQERA